MRILPWLRRKTSSHGRPSTPEGLRAYAVGDVHGRLDLLNNLLDRIEADACERSEANIRVIFLGDLVDRGPDSNAVVERLRTWRPNWAKPVFLCGNHEEAFLRVLRGEREIFRDWLRYGGAPCAESYGLDPNQLISAPYELALQRLRSRVPHDHVQFLESFADSLRMGDYLFVHAGIRPGLPIEDQSVNDLRWIREPFLSYKGTHGFVVVHGHTIVDEVEQKPNRIGLDTGAYWSGRLTAMGVQGEERWFLTAEVAPENPSHSSVSADWLSDVGPSSGF